MHGDIAARNAARDPRRTGATAATLASGLSVLEDSAAQYLHRATTLALSAGYVVKSAGGQQVIPTTAAPLKKLGGAEYSPLGQSTGFRLGGSEPVLTGVDLATMGKLPRYDVFQGPLGNLAKGPDRRGRLQGREGGLARRADLPLARQNGRHGGVTIGALCHVDEQSDLVPSITAPDSLVARYDSAPSTAGILVTTEGGPSRAAPAGVTRALGDTPTLTVERGRGPVGGCCSPEGPHQLGELVWSMTLSCRGGGGRCCGRC